jgi:glycosyltransferase involved in cell wall biosynthesis
MVGYTTFRTDPRLMRHVGKLVKSGFDVDVVTLASSDFGRESNTEHIRFFLPMTRRYERQSLSNIIIDYCCFTFFVMIILLRNHLFDTPYALVHINNMPNFLIYAAMPLKLMRVPIVLDIHDTMPEIFQSKFGVQPGQWLVRLLVFEERLCMSLADFVITTEHTKWLRLQLNGLKPEKSEVVLNLPDPSIFPELPLPDAPSQNTGKFRLVYHGTMARRFGLDIAIQAVATLGETIPGLCFDIVGEGEAKEKLNALTRSLGIEDRVHFSESSVPVEALAEILREADLGVIPSRNDAATQLMLPTKLLEYVCLGIPCVTVPTLSIQFYFSEPQIHLVPSEDPGALAQKIQYLYDNPSVRLSTVREARKFFQTYQFETEMERYESIVKRFLSDC